MRGPLRGLRIIEMAGIGPGPFAAMMLADHGAEVIRIERPGAREERKDPLLRSRVSATLDMKSADDVARLRALARTCDGLIEGYRPGVMERLGLGPDVLLQDNKKLVYGRMTGWGQTGPMSQIAGHDINYIAVSGALGMSGRKGGPPTPAVNLVGDFGGGGMLLAFGMLAALLEVGRGGDGQVVDCAMTDGSALLTAMMWGFRAAGRWNDERGTNMLDTGAPFYDTYETADGQYVAIGAIEPQFYAELKSRLGLAGNPLFDTQHDRAAWPAQKKQIAAIFATRTRSEWCEIFDGADACFAPVLNMAEAPEHPQNRTRETFITLDGVIQPAPAPRYSRTDLPSPRPQRTPGADTAHVLQVLAQERMEAQ